MRIVKPAVLAAAVVAGLGLGFAVRERRAAGAALSASVRTRGPNPAAVQAALLEADARELDRRLARLKEEEARLTRERDLAKEKSIAARPSFEAQVRKGVRDCIDHNQISIYGDIQAAVKEKPEMALTLLRLAAAEARGRLKGARERARLRQFVRGHVPFYDAVRRKVADLFLEAQAKETDPLVRAWMLDILAESEVTLPADQLSDIARTMRLTDDPAFRESGFRQLLSDPPTYADLLRESLRAEDPAGRARQILEAWDRRALPVVELRAFVREGMNSDNPSEFIDLAERWVPKYMNPFAPQETIKLFEGTFWKPISAYHKAVSIVVLGSIASAVPGKPGRAEIERFASTTDDDRLKKAAAKALEIVDSGKGYSAFRSMDPADFGLEYPR